MKEFHTKETYLTLKDSRETANSIIFKNSNSIEVGRFCFEGDKLTFIGDADESVKVFVEALAHYIKLPFEFKKP